MEDSKPTPEKDVAKARESLAKGDLEHALHHVGCALATNPMHPEWMQLIADIVGASRHPQQLGEISGDTSFITAANRSYVLAWMRKWDEALDLITDVAEIRPDIPYLLWAEWWLSQPGVLQSIPWEQFARGILIDLAKITMRCPIGMKKDDPRRPNVECAGRIIMGIRGVHGQQSFVWFTGALISRRLGTFEEGVQMAQYAYQLEPSWKNAVCVANLLSDQKKIDEATQWYRKGIAHDPKDASAHVDMGDMFLNNGRFDEALAEYETACKKEADHPWATASIHYIHFKKTKDPNQRLCLLRLAEDGSDRARQLCNELDPPVPYVTLLPRPGDASCNALNHIFEQMYENPASHANSTVKLELSHLESPSVVIAFWLQMEMWGLMNQLAPLIALDYQVKKVQQPDPRQPKAQIPYVLWAWDGVVPKQACPRPDAGIAREIQQIAMEPFHLDVWVPACEQLGKRLGPSAVPHILGTMVYPPRPNGGSWRVLNWTQRVQVACALVAAFVDGGWAGSERQRALYSLAYGPSDWTVGAGIIALGVLARKDPSIRPEVEQAFGWLRSQVPQEGFCAWEYPLVCTWKSLGGPPDVAQWLERVENEEGKSTVHMCELVAKKFDQAAEMQKAQQAQAAIAAGDGGDPDPLVFPGGKVPKLSDYVGLMKQMQAGNMMGALGALGLDMTAYGQVAMAWGQKLAADPMLSQKFAAMMAR